MTLLVLVAWGLAAFWGLVLLASFGTPLRRLPDAQPAATPPYTLWLADDTPVPSLEPAPTAVHRGPAPPGKGWVLALSGGVEVPTDLPARLAAADAPFVSVFPRPAGGAVALAAERLRRDFSAPEAVVDPARPSAYADPRCAWFDAADLLLPGAGDEPVLRTARARKAHGLAVDLREGAADVRAPARSHRWHTAHLPDLVDGDALLRGLTVSGPLIVNLVPMLAIGLPETRLAGVVGFGLGCLARLNTARRDGFGRVLTLAGWLAEPIVSLRCLGAARRVAPGLPALPEAASPERVNTGVGRAPGWVLRAGVPYLAHHLGGSAVVMEALYANIPRGRGRLGAMLDGWAHRGVAARAVRRRRLAVVEFARALAPRRLLSVPAGGGGDAADIGADETVLVDPDPSARALAASRCPGAEIVDGGVEDAPDGPFDAVLYVGLSEYFDDEEVVAHLRALAARLAPEGRLITTTTADHPDRARMARWLGWDTRARSAEGMRGLLGRADLEVTDEAVDPNRVQWVFSARRVG